MYEVRALCSLIYSIATVKNQEIHKMYKINNILTVVIFTIGFHKIASAKDFVFVLSGITPGH